MKLKIYNQFDELKLTVSPSDNSTRQRGVMADHMLALSFVSFDFVRLDVNDWVEFEGQRENTFTHFSVTSLWLSLHSSHSCSL